VLAIAAPVQDQSANIAFTVSTVMIRGGHDEGQINALGEAVRDLGKRLESVLF
jgi:DNA-binding IclR family transcriptional regulator